MKTVDEYIALAEKLQTLPVKDIVIQLMDLACEAKIEGMQTMVDGSVEVKL